MKEEDSCEQESSFSLIIWLHNFFTEESKCIHKNYKDFYELYLKL